MAVQDSPVQSKAFGIFHPTEPIPTESDRVESSRVKQFADNSNRYCTYDTCKRKGQGDNKAYIDASRKRIPNPRLEAFQAEKCGYSFSYIRALQEGRECEGKLLFLGDG